MYRGGDMEQIEAFYAQHHALILIGVLATALFLFILSPLITLLRNRKNDHDKKDSE